MARPSEPPAWISLSASEYRHERVAFLPFVKLCLKTRKPGLPPQNPTTLGERLRKRRREIGFYQRQVAKRMGVTVDTLINWERDRVEPENRYWPNIIAFLGYDPHPKPQTLGQRLRAKYRELGLPRKEVARQLGVDENTLQRYEEDISKPVKVRTQRLIEEFLGGDHLTSRDGDR